MYKCQILGTQSKPGAKLNKVVVQTRGIEYKHWDHEAEENWSSFGVEIVKEVNASDEGVQVWESWSDDEKAEFVKGLA